MNNAWPTLAAAFAVSAAMIALLKRLAPALGLLDNPGRDPLKIHRRPIPLIGGPGMIAGVLVGVTTSARTSSDGWRLAAVLLPALCVAAIGIRDDRRPLPPLTRLLAEIGSAAAAVLLASASGLTSSADPLWLVLAAVYIVGSINAVNMQDGLDGYAGVLMLISALGCAGVAVATDGRIVAQSAFALSGAIAGFLIFNLPPASVFMGDSGSYFLGFVVAAFALVLSASVGTVTAFAGGVLMIGVPVLDAAAAIVRRFAAGRSPMAGDRGHLYDLLLQRGLAPRHVVAIGAAVQALVVGAGVSLSLWQSGDVM